MEALLIDLKEDKAARAVVFGLLREMEREQMYGRVTGVTWPHKAAASGGEADRHVNRAGRLNLPTGSRVLVNNGAGKFL